MNIFLNSRRLDDGLFLVDWKVNEIKGQLEIKAAHSSSVTMQYASAESLVLKRLMNTYQSDNYFVISEMANDIEELLFEEGLSIDHIYFEAAQVALSSEPSKHIALTSIGPLVLSNQAILTLQELEGFTSSKQVLTFLSKSSLSAGNLKRSKEAGNQYIKANDYTYVVSFDGNIKGFKTFFLIAVIKNERKDKSLFSVKVRDQKVRFDKDSLVGLLNLVESKLPDMLNSYSVYNLIGQFNLLNPIITNDLLKLTEINVDIKLSNVGGDTFKVDELNGLMQLSKVIPHWFTNFEAGGHQVRLNKAFAKKMMAELNVNELDLVRDYISKLIFTDLTPSPIFSGIYHLDFCGGQRLIVNEDMQIISKVEQTEMLLVDNNNLKFVVKLPQLELFASLIRCEEDTVVAKLNRERISFNPDLQDQERLNKGQFIISYPGLKINFIVRWAQNGIVYALSAFKSEQVPPYVLIDEKKYIFSNAAKKLVLQSKLINENKKLTSKEAIEQITELHFVDVTSKQDLSSSNFDFCLESTINGVRLFGFINSDPRNLTVAFIENK